MYRRLGIKYSNLRDFKKALEYHKLDLSIANDAEDRPGKGVAYANLGLAYDSLCDFKTALKYHELHLGIAKEVGDRADQGRAYANIGNAYRNLGDFGNALENHKLELGVAKAVGDRSGEGRANGNLGLVYNSLGEFKKALEYHQLDLSIAKDVKDIAGEGRAYGNLGRTHHSLGNFKNALECHQSSLSIAKDVGDRTGQGRAYGNIGLTCRNLGDFKKALEYHQLHLDIAKEVGNRAGEGKAYANLGSVYNKLGDFQKALEHHQLHLSIAKEVGDKDGEGRAYGNLGIAYRNIGDLKESLRYHKLHLEIAIDVGDRDAEGRTYGNLGLIYRTLGDFENAIENHKLFLGIVEDIGDKAGQGKAYANLGLAYRNLGDFESALKYHKLHLGIVKDVSDKAGQGKAYANLGLIYSNLGHFKSALECHKLHLSIAKAIGDKAGEGRAYAKIGSASYSLGDLAEAERFYQSSVRVRDNIRDLIHSKDEWKISLREHYKDVYTALWDVQLQQNKTNEALVTAEQGRGQALMDLMELKYGLKLTQTGSSEQMRTASDISRYISSQTVFLAFGRNTINFWVLQKGNKPLFMRMEINKDLESLIRDVYQRIGAGRSVRCDDRSLDGPTEEDVSDKRSKMTESAPLRCGKDALQELYGMIIFPIAEFIQGDEVTIVPDGPLYFVPFAALLDQNSNYLSDIFSIRLIPSLTSLKLIAECPEGYHSTTGALLVGDPCVEGVRIRGKRLEQLPSAREEVEMIGKILDTDPLTGKRATKAEVLSRLTSVSVVHIAAHGCPETGEIVLSPNPTALAKKPKEKDFLLTMKDVLNSNLKARLVVLSCCHSGRGEIKAEGVVGIARAFLGAGARSVLVSLWAIDDKATQEIMKHFYQHLREGQSASKSLNQAMKCMRESDEFSDVRYWAPFVLIGDDVTMNVGQTR